MSKSPIKRAEGRAAEGAELFLVDLLEERALVEVDRRLEVARELLLAGVEDLDLHHGSGGRVLAQVVQTAPAGLELLELGVGASPR